MESSTTVAWSCLSAFPAPVRARAILSLLVIVAWVAVGTASSGAAESFEKTPTVQQLGELLRRQQAELDAARKEIAELRQEVRGTREGTAGAETRAPEPVPLAPASRPSPVAAAEASSPPVVGSVSDPDPRWPQEAPGTLELSSYGVINYSHYDWDTDQGKRDSVDVERVTAEAEYQALRILRLEAEVEFEHLGTGTAVEFDNQEEFGEFETEIDRGGEVQIEEVQLLLEPWRLLNLRVGYYPIPVGTLSLFHQPNDYFMTVRPFSEATILPNLWTDTGVEAYGFIDDLTVGDFSYRIGAVNGLDSSGFSSANWVAPGHQTRFEVANAEDIAGYASIRYLPPLPGLNLGTSIYYGDTADNRPKPDLDVDAYVTIWSVDARYEHGPVLFRGAYIGGHLQNSAVVTAANKKLSNNLNVKRTPVAADAAAGWAELGFDGSELFHYWPSGFIPFGRFDWVNSMEDVQAPVIKNPRWDRTAWTIGFDYRFLRYLVLKAAYTHLMLDIPDDDIEDTWSVGLAYDIALPDIHLGFDDD